MWLLRTALRRPFTVIVAVIGIALCSIFALVRMPIDIFPNLNLPVVYVAQPFGGMSPSQMEGYLVYYYEYHFLYITGIESVESKSIQNVGLVKLTFHPETDMSQALAQICFPIHYAVRRRQRARRLSGFFQCDAECRGDPGSCAEPCAAAVCDFAWSVRSPSLWWCRPNDCRQ